MKLLIVLTFGVLFTVSASTKAQYQKVNLSAKNASLIEVFDLLQQKSNISFVFKDETVNSSSQTYDLNYQDTDLSIILNDIFNQEGLAYKVVDNIIIVLSGYDSGQTMQQDELIISGKVVDDKNEPLPGVNVFEASNISNGVITGIDGTYTISLSRADALLTFSFIGFEDQTFTVEGKTVLNVVMQEAYTDIDEVIVVGYGTTRKASVVGAVSQINSESIEGRAVQNVSQALQGTAANLIIQDTGGGEPGQGTSINIRGISTMNNNSPLVVIDGIVGGDLDLLNPNDIESVSVLKDAGSSAIYGSRSSNGVILVTTKKGKKNSAPSIKISTQVGVQTPDILFKPVRGYENAILRNQAMVNAGNSPIYSPADIQQMKDEGDNEWFFDSITQNSLQQNHNVSVSGGGEHTTYNVSLGYLDQESVFVGPGYGLDRTNFRVNMVNEFGKFKLITNMAYALTNLKTHTTSSGFLIADATRTPVDYRYRLKDANDRYLVNDVLSQYNPLGILEAGGSRQSDNDNISVNVSGEFQINKALKVKGVFGADIRANHTKNLVNEVYFYTSEESENYTGTYGTDLNADDDNEKIRFYNSQLLLEYSKKIGDHQINGLIGASNESYQREAQRIRMIYSDPDLHIPTSDTEISSSSLITPQATTERSLNSIFGRIGYSYKDKYLFEVNFRYDGTSKFADDKRWGVFPSASVGWRLSEEGLLSGYKEKIGNLKLRGSYGILGNQNVRDYIYYNTYFLYNNAYSYNNAPVAGTGLQLGNEELQWETSKNLNLGLDATFLSNHLSVSADYFNTLTTDILLTPVVPGTFGGSVSDYNAGEMRSQGWELTLAYHLKHGQFTHDFSINLADSWNNVEDFGGNQRIESSDQMQKITMAGIAFNSYYGYKTDGYFQNLDEVMNDPKPIGATVVPGDIRYKDKNDDGVIDDDDRYVLGNAFPRYTFGFTYNFKWKNIDFSALVQGVGKRNMFLRGELVEPYHSNYSYTMYQHQLDFWTPTNPNAQNPRLAAPGSASNVNNYGRSSDYYIFDASYIRLKDIQIGYTLPQNLTRKVGIKNARLFVDARNLLTISALDFINPESTEFNNNMSNSGANSGRNYPTPKYYGFGVDINF